MNCKYFLPFYGLLFYFLNDVLCSTKVFYFHDVQFIYFFFFKFIFIYLFIYFLAMLGLRCCARAFSSCSEQGPLFIAVCGLLIAVASLVAEHRL